MGEPLALMHAREAQRRAEQIGARALMLRDGEMSAAEAADRIVDFCRKLDAEIGIVIGALETKAASPQAAAEGRAECNGKSPRPADPVTAAPAAAPAGEGCGCAFCRAYAAAFGPTAGPTILAVDVYGVYPVARTDAAPPGGAARPSGRAVENGRR
jgi:hypothetical protein